MSKRSTEGDLVSTDGSLQTSNPKGREGIPKKILVVEDEFLEAMNIKEDLLLSGYEVPGVATNGEDAIRMATEVRPDLILMDITLDGPMSGIGAAAVIRKAHSIPIVYLTAHADAHLVKGAKATEPCGYLPKPCPMATMISTIEMALSKNAIDTKIKRRERQSFTDELSARDIKLQEANTALKVLLEQRDLERRELERTIQANVSKLILPAVRALECGQLTESQKIQVESIKINLNLLTEAHGHRLSHLSSTEMQVANFVKAGKCTKEIAQFLHVSASTINTHRDNIRKKLGIKNTKTNLKVELQHIF